MLYYIHQVKENTENQKGKIMKIQLSFMLVIVGMIDYIIWTMDEVPYGPVCWIIPLVVGIIFAIIKEYTEE